MVFGNESSGLPDDYLKYGQSVFIPHSDKIDSLNLSMALGITLCHFSMMNSKINRYCDNKWIIEIVRMYDFDK
ncbi:MAG: TrmH family RNA methyltransferase [Thomasclavelia ramosa]